MRRILLFFYFFIINKPKIALVIVSTRQVIHNITPIKAILFFLHFSPFNEIIKPIIPTGMPNIGKTHINNPNIPKIKDKISM